MRKRARLSGRALESLWLFALVAVSVAAAASEARRVKDIRLGSHRDFDRIVVQLDARARVERRDAPPGALELWIEAQPALPLQRVEAARRLGRVDFAPGDGGVFVRIPPRDGRTRAFLLQRPFRVVIDVAPAGAASLPIPEGAEEIPLVEAAPAPVAEAPPPVPTPPVAEPPPPPAPVERPSIAEAPRATPSPPAPSIAPAPPPPPEPAPEPAKPEPEPALPSAAPAPLDKPPEARAPAPKPPRVEPPRAEPEERAAETPASGQSMWQQLIGAGLATIAGLAAVAALVVLWVALRRRRAPLAPDFSDLDVDETPFSREPSVVTRSELVGAGTSDRLETVEKRLDEEARARAALEEKVFALHEEVKVLRDRTNRLAKGPGA